MKYFSPSYWFKLWVLSAPLFNSEKGINAKSINNNQKIKNWASKNTSLESINQEINYTNSSTNYQPYNLSQINQNINPIYQIELETSTHKHRHEKSRNKRQDLHDDIENISKKNENEQIEFMNNNFFYKFKLDYDSNKVWGSMSTGRINKIFSNIAIKNWTKYANNWEEFLIKFPAIELINLNTELGGQGESVKKQESKLKFSLLGFRKKLEETDIRDTWADNLSDVTVISRSYHLLVCNQWSSIYIRIYPDNEKLMIQNIFQFLSQNAVYRTFGSLKYDSIRFIGEIDMNPLISIMIEKTQTIENWYKSAQEVIQYLRSRPNYDTNELELKEKEINDNLIDKLTQWKIDYYQNLILIENNNEILELKAEIEKIKVRLDNLEKQKTCLKNVVDEFRKKPTSSFDKTIDSITDGNPAKVIAKATIKSLSTSFLKGPIVGVLICISESLFLSRRKREIFDINNLQEKNDLKNVTKWTNEFTKSINNEQHLPIENKPNFSTTNITSL